MGKNSKQDPNEPSGRITFDDRGNALWEWRTDTGTFSSDVDTQRVKALQESTDVQLRETTTPTGADPYSTAGAPQVLEQTSRRTLNDMRILSEEIKRARASKKSSE
jgi:hypothetical protein